MSDCMTRRGVAGLAVILLVVTSGCTGLFSGPVSFSASQATVSDAALNDTQYEHNRTHNLTVERTFEAAGQSKTVKVTNWISEYHKSVEVPGVGTQKVAVFATFTSPQVELLGQSFNPLAKFSNKQLAEKFTEQLNAVNNLQQVSTHNRTVLGKQTTVTKFKAQVTTQAGVTFDAYVHVTKVEHNGDHVVAIAVYPQRLPNEGDTVKRLLDGLTH